MLKNLLWPGCSLLAFCILYFSVISPERQIPTPVPVMGAVIERSMSPPVAVSEKAPSENTAHTLQGPSPHRSITPEAPQPSFNSAPDSRQRRSTTATASLPMAVPSTQTFAPATPSSRTSADSYSNLATSPSSYISASTPANPNSTQEWELPSGYHAPAAFLQTAENLTPAAVMANEQVAQSFEREIDTTGSVAADGVTEISEDAWARAQSRADELYRSLFGDMAYNSLGVQGGTDTYPTQANTP